MHNKSPQNAPQLLYHRILRNEVWTEMSHWESRIAEKQLFLTDTVFNNTLFSANCVHFLKILLSKSEIKHQYKTTFYGQEQT